MLHQEFGSVILGFTAEMKCSHCKNLKPMQVRQVYVKQSAFLIPMGTSHNAIFKYCPVCEKEDYIIKWKPMFSGEGKINEVISLLESGKELTKYWANRLNSKDKEQLLKRLNNLKAYSLVTYIGS